MRDVLSCQRLPQIATATTDPPKAGRYSLQQLKAHCIFCTADATGHEEERGEGSLKRSSLSTATRCGWVKGGQGRGTLPHTRQDNHIYSRQWEFCDINLVPMTAQVIQQYEKFTEWIKKLPSCAIQSKHCSAGQMPAEEAHRKTVQETQPLRQQNPGNLATRRGISGRAMRLARLRHQMPANSSAPSAQRDSVLRTKAS